MLTHHASRRASVYCSRGLDCCRRRTLAGGRGKGAAPEGASRRRAQQQARPGSSGLTRALRLTHDATHAPQGVFRDHDIDGSALLSMDARELRSWGLPKEDVSKVVTYLTVLREVMAESSDSSGTEDE